MKMRIPERDIEAISAYLDGQLSSRERTRLETRFQTDPGLREAYEQMHRTRAVLRSLPAMRAPRNFTLTPQMVKARKSPPAAYPVLRLASVMATLLFVLVMVGDLVTPRGVALAPVMQTQTEEATTLMEAPAGTESAILEAAPAAESEEGNLRSMAEDQVQEGTAGAEAPPSAAMEMTEAIPETEEQGFNATPPAEPTLAAEASVQKSDLDQRDAETSLPATWNLWRILQVVFALVAVTTGVGAALLRRGVTG